MDALVKAAIESMLKRTLPQLQQELEAALMADVSKAPEHLSYLIEESSELLGMLKQWSNPQEKSESTSSELEDHPEADDPAMLAMLQSMESSPEETASASDDAMSDEAAMAMLAEMDGSAEEPLDDAAALALLAQMDEPASTPSVANTPKPAAAPAPAAHGHDAEDAEDLREIPEWEPNDFQSDPSMLNDFIVNADELMQVLDDTILRLEQEPNNKDIIEEIFRAAHTLKGGSGMFGFKGIERVMHRMENLFDLIRKEKLVPNSDIIDTVFQGLDLLRTLLKAVKDGKPCGVVTAPVVHALSLAAKGRAIPKRASGESSGSSAAKTTPQNETADDSSGQKASKTDTDRKDDAKKKEQSTIRVDLERLDVLVNLVGELVIDRTRFASIEEDLRTNYPQIKLGGNFSETVQLFSRHMNEIQDIIMKVRMVPIGNAFNKFTRVVRDLARSLDKRIDLVISGEHAELDKTLVEQIGDPLIHLIRNSCDHGIEMPDTREKTGKDPVGKIFLDAHQEGNQIVISITDDGKGMDPAIIRRKAIEKGLITEEEQLSSRDILNLIFEPGFSTAEKVTNISGRGVGMDVVKKQIMKLKGMIELDSAPGRGTKTLIRLPLTLAIVQSLLVRSRGEIFAIPLGAVIESIRISPKEIQRIGEVEVYRLRETVLPLVHLEEAMQLGTTEGTVSDLIHTRQGLRRTRLRTDRLFVVVVGQPDRPIGIVVDQLLNQQEMVIKSMGPLMRNIPCVAGGAVLGQGEVVLVLDIPELEAISRGRNRMQAVS